MYIQVKRLCCYASKHTEKARATFKCDGDSVSSEHILNTHLALFQPPAIQDKDSKHILLESVVWTSENTKGSSQKSLIFNQRWNMHKSSNFKPRILSNAISIKNKQCLISSHWVSIFVRKSFGTMCLYPLLVFENLDKTKKFNSLKFATCFIKGT